MAAQSGARAGVIQARLHTLHHIKWEDIQGPMGPGDPLQYLCRGGYSTVYKGVWQVSMGGRVSEVWDGRRFTRTDVGQEGLVWGDTHLKCGVTLIVYTRV